MEVWITCYFLYLSVQETLSSSKKQQAERLLSASRAPPSWVWDFIYFFIMLFGQLSVGHMLVEGEEEGTVSIIRSNSDRV